MVAESRVEVVFLPALRRRVLEVVRSVHPYEEPAYDVLELAATAGQSGSSRGHGRIGRLAEPTTLREFAARVDAALPSTAHGVRVAGDPDRRVETVVVGSGAGDFMLDTVLGTDADAYVTSDLRHHRASEFLEHGGTGAGRRRALGSRVDLAPRRGAQTGRRRRGPGRYGGDPGERRRHRPVDLPGRHQGRPMSLPPTEHHPHTRRTP